MKAVVYNKKGVPDKLVFCDVEKPRPTDNEVLVQIVAASVNAMDYRSIRMGSIPKRISPKVVIHTTLFKLSPGTVGFLSINEY